MPSSVENVCELLKLKKYEEISKLICVEPELVSVVRDKFGSTLFQALLANAKKSSELISLIQQVATHQAFRFGDKNAKTHETNLDSIISLAHLDILLLCKGNSEIIYNKVELSFLSAKKQLALLENTLRIAIVKAPEAEKTASLKEKIQQTMAIVNLLRDETILFAFKTDDPQILDQLILAGDTPSNRLSEFNGQRLPVHLLTEATPKLKAWFEKRANSLAEEISSNPNSFHNMAQKARQASAQLASLELNHANAVLAVRNEAIESKLAVLSASAL